MSKKKTIFQKYLDAESTLSEEKDLFDAQSLHPAGDAWVTYVKRHRKQAPVDLKSSLWRSIQTRKRMRQKFLWRVSAAAASVAVLITLSVYTTRDKPMSYEEKQAVLNEALSLFPEETTAETRQNIIYEDDMIIIYTASK